MFYAKLVLTVIFKICKNVISIIGIFKTIKALKISELKSREDISFMCNFVMLLGYFEDFLCCQKMKKKTVLKFKSGYMGLKNESACSVLRLFNFFC